MKKLNWRLSKLPTPDEVRELVKDKIITQEEAREILFNHEDDLVRDEKSFKEEIKFLRELVDKLSKSPATIVETIKYIEKPYHQTPWYKPYYAYCSNTAQLMGTYTSSGDTTNLQLQSFSAIS